MTSPRNTINRQIARYSTDTSAAVVVLLLLLVSLVAIVLLAPPTDLISRISIILLLVCLFVTLFGGRRGVGVVGLVASAVSVVAVDLYARAYLGSFAGRWLAVIWAIVLILVVRRAMRNLVYVPHDRAILILNMISGYYEQPEPPVALPLVPLVQRKVAEIPLYALDNEFEVKDVNTEPGGDKVVASIKVHVRYRVSNTAGVIDGIPSRGQVQEEVAANMKLTLEQAANNPIFWERLLERQMRVEVEDIVRMVVREQANPQTAYRKSAELAEDVKQRLRERVETWGVWVELLDFEDVKVKGDFFKDPGDIEKQREGKRKDAELEAYRVRQIMTALAEGESVRLAAIIKSLQDLNIELPTEVIVSAIQGSSDAILEGEFVAVPPGPDAGAAPKPADQKAKDAK